MNTIEERVLEMRFDNKQFTAETKNTLSMLERLKAALQFSNSGKEIDKMARSMSNVRFDGIASGIEAITNRFSTFGIVGMRVIENVTDGIMSKLVGAVNYAKNAIVSGGVKRAMNIENAHFQLQALLKDETKVQAVMANANESVDGTAYAYDEAAKAAAMFAASGIEAGDEMLGALKGITGVAAMTNAEFSAISMIFTTVAGNGRLMGDQLLQLSSRGLNAASTLTDYFKEVEHQAGMTETKVREMVSKGQISFKTFAAAMNWAFGDSAKRANETFTGAMSNMRSALARIGAGFVSPLIEQNGVLVDMFNALRITFNEVKGTLVFDQATSSVEGFGRALGMTTEQAEKFYSKVEKKGHVTLKNLKSIQKNGEDGYSQLRDYFNGINDGSIRASYAVTKAIKDMSDGNKVTRQDIRKFVKEGKVDFSIFSNAMEEAFGSQKQKLSKRFTDFAIKNLDDLRETIEGFDVQKGMDIAYKGFDSIINIVKALASIIKPVATSFSNVFLGFDPEDIMRAAVSIEKFTKKLTISEESADKLQRTFTGVFDIIALVGDGMVQLIKSFVPFGPSIKEGSDSLLDFAANMGDNLSTFAKWVRESDVVSEVTDKIAETLHNVYDSLTDVVEKAKEILPIQEIVSAIGPAIDRLSLKFENAKNKFVPFSDMLSILLGFIKDIGSSTVMAVIEGIGDGIGKIITAFSEAKSIKTGGTNSVLDIFNAGVLITLGVQLSKFIGLLSGTVKKGEKSLDSFIGIFKNIGTNINKVLTSVSGTFNAFQQKLNAETLKEIGFSLGLITGSIVALSMIDSGKLTESITAVSLLLGELVGILTLITKLEVGKSVFRVQAAANVLNTLSISVGILALAMSKLSKMDPERLADSLVSVMLLIGELVGSLIILSKYGGKVKSNALAIIALAEAVNILATAASKFGSLDMEILKKGLISVGLLLGGLTAFMYGAKFGKFKPSQALAIIGLSTALLILQKAVAGFGSLNVNVLTSGLVGVGAVLTEIAAFTFVSGKSKNMLSTSVALIAISEALNRLIVPLQSFGSMSPTEIGNGLLTMGLALGEIAAAVHLLPKNTLVIAAGLYVMSEAIKEIVGSMAEIGNMSVESLIKAIVGLGVALSALALAANAMNGTLVGSAAMILMATALKLLTPSLVTLGNMSLTEIATSMVALAASFALIGGAAYLLTPVIPSILALAGALALIGVAAISFGAGVAAISIGLTSLAVSGVAGATALVSAMNLLLTGLYTTIANTAGAFKDAFVAVILAACSALSEAAPILVETLLTVAIQVLGSLADHTPTLVSEILRLIVGVIDALAANMPTVIQSVVNLLMSVFQGIVDSLNSMDTEILVKGIAGIGMIAALMAAISSLTLMVPTATAGVISLGVFVVELTALLAAIGGIAQIPGVSWLVGEGGNLLSKIGEALGKFVSGFGVGLASGLPEIGSSLSRFAINALPFLTTMSMLDPNTAKGVKALASMLITLTGASIINGITSFFGKLVGGSTPLEKIGEELANFAPYIKRFADSIKGINPAAVSAAAAVGEMISKLYDALPKEGGLLSKITGESMGLTKFAQELVSFGPVIAVFAATVKNVTEDSAKGAAAAASIVAEVYDKLPKEGSWLEKITGKNMSLADFGTELLLFGPSISAFAMTVKNVTEDSVKGAAAAASMIAEIYGKLPKEEGWLENIFGGGNMSLSDFAGELLLFGPSISAFAMTVKNVTEDSVKGAAAAASIIADLATNLPDTSTLKEKIFGGGQVTLSKFGEELVSFGPYMVDFVELVRDISEEDVKGAMDASKLIVATVGGIVNNQGTVSLTDFGYDMESFGGSLERFYNQMNTIDFSQINSVTGNIKKLVDTAQEVGGEIATKFAAAVKGSSKEATDAVNNLLTKVLNSITKARPKFNDRGNKAAQEFVDGIKSYNKNTGVNVIQANAEQLAKYYAQGFANGIEDNLHIATRAAAKMARKADEAVANVLEEHSPSKVAEQRGKWYNEGLVIGIEKSADLPVKAAAEVATEVTEATEENLNVSKAVDKTAEQVTEGVKKVAKALQPMSEHFKKTGSAIQKDMNTLTKGVAKAYKQLDSLQRQADKNAKKREKQQATEEKWTEKYNKEVEEQVKLLNMSAKERKEYAKQAAKDAKIQAQAEENAANKIRQQYDEYLERRKNRGPAISSEIKGLNTYYKNLMTVVESGNNKIRYADMELADAEVDIWNRITEAMESYREKWTSTRDQIMSEMNFFDEVSPAEPKTKEELFKNAKEQIDVSQRFMNVQDQLAKRLKGTELADYIAEQGIDQVEQLELINQMTDEELKEYSDLYSQKLSLAGTLAKKQLKDFQKEVETELEDVLTGLYDNIDLYDFMDVFAKGLEGVLKGKKNAKVKKKKSKKSEETSSPVKKTSSQSEDVSPVKGPGYDLGVSIGENMKTGQISTIEDSQSDISKQVNDTISETTKDNKPKAKSSGKSLGKAGADGISSTKSMYYNAGSEAGGNLAAGLRSQAENVRQAAAELAEAMRISNDMERAGSHAAEGLSQGVDRSQATIFSSGVSMANTLVTAVTRTLGIHSPSVVMAKLGNFTTLGFVGGLLQNLASVAKASDEISNTVANSIKPELPRFFDDLDFNPVITPVVDMSNITKSIDDIQNMFNSSIGMVAANVQTTAGMMNRRGRVIDDMNDQSMKSGDSPNSYIFNQYNQSPKALSSIDIYRNTKNQFAQFREAVDNT